MASTLHTQTVSPAGRTPLPLSSSPSSTSSPQWTSSPLVSFSPKVTGARSKRRQEPSFQPVSSSSDDMMRAESSAFPILKSRTGSTTQARLHKRASSNSTAACRQSPRDSLQNTSSYTLPMALSPELDHPVDHVSPATKYTSRDKLKQNLRRLGTRDNIDPASLDLSRTAAENEERTGLGIHMNSQSQDTPTDAATTTFSPSTGARNRTHARSFSHTSIASNMSAAGAFKPTTPFVHPVRQSPRPPATPSMSHSNSADSSEHSDQPIRPRAESSLSTTAHDFGDSNPTNTSLPSGARPALRINTSGSSTRASSASQTHVPFSASGQRSRRGTMDTGTPQSRASMDRAVSFIRGDKEPIDALTRAATIQAARQAFEDREKEKARKHERRETKAAERRERQVERREEKHRRKSDAGPRRSSTAAGVRGDHTLRHTTSGTREPSNMKDLSRLYERSSTDGTYPPISRKRAAKSRYLRFWTWLKTRLLYLGRQSTTH